MRRDMPILRDAVPGVAIVESPEARRWSSVHMHLGLGRDALPTPHRLYLSLGVTPDEKATEAACIEGNMAVRGGGERHGSRRAGGANGVRFTSLRTDTARLNILRCYK